VSDDAQFICERLLKLNANAKRNIAETEDDYHRIILELLRTRTPSRRMLLMVANELERLWKPEAQQKKHERRSDERVFLMHADKITAFLAARYQKQGAHDPKTKAKQDAAQLYGLSVEGLRKKRHRYRKRTRKI
jgi:hypothetical protein